MSTTIQTLYNQCCYALCEDGGLTLGLFTEQQFLDILGVVILDFAQRTGLYKNIYTQTINAGVPQYTVPDNVIEPELCFVGGKIIEHVTEQDLSTGHYAWRKQKGWPKQWHQDNLPPKSIELFPSPEVNGVAYTAPSGQPGPYGVYNDFKPNDRNLTMIGATGPTITSWTLTDGEGNPVLLECVPDSFSPYIVYGVLEQVFSAEGETRDLQRAAYCRTRWLEGVNLANSICREDLLEEEDQ